MTYIELVRHYFPEASVLDLEDILWGCTGFHAFWHIPRDGRTPIECLCTQLSRIARRSGGNVNRAMHLADHATDNAMRRVRTKETR